MLWFFPGCRLYRITPLLSGYDSAVTALEHHVTALWRSQSELGA
jgi:hypothetical protein